MVSFPSLSRSKGLKWFAALVAALFIIWNLDFLISFRDEQKRLEENATLLANAAQLSAAVFTLEKVIDFPAALKYPIAREAVWEVYHSDYRRLSHMVRGRSELSVIIADLKLIDLLLKQADAINSNVIRQMRLGNDVTRQEQELRLVLDEAMFTSQRASAILQGHQGFISFHLRSAWNRFTATISMWCLLALSLVVVLNRLQASTQRRLRIEEELKHSRTNLQTIFDHSLHGFILLDLDRRVQSFNSYAAETTKVLSGKSIAVGLPLEDAIREEFRPSFLECCEEVKEGLVVTVERRVNDNLIGDKWYEIDYNPVYDESGSITSICVTLLDITERKQNQETLRRSEERFRMLVKHSSDMIAVLDPEGFFVYQSPSSERILGFQDHELIGTSAFELVHPEDLGAVRTAFQRTLAIPEEEIVLEFRALRSDGSYIYLECVGTNLLSNHAIHGIVINSRDLTRRKQMEMQLVAAKDQAEEMNRLKTSFLANMSHEIRTPMTAILGFASILKENLTDEENAQHVDTIERSGKRLLDTINGILDLAKVESNQIEFKTRAVHVSREIDRVLTLLKPIADSKGLFLDLLTHDQGLLASCDPKYLSQILTNLIGNAIKFTDKGGISIQVRSQLQEKGYFVVVDVIDTGIGIGKDFLAHIFDEFKQESNGWGRRYEGTGLGLTISKRLIELMDGRLTVESSQGIGSKFTIQLPLSLASLASEPLTVGEPQMPVISNGERTMPKVLLVEDNLDNAAMVRYFLKGICTVTHTDNAEQAIALALSKYFDLAFMDINLGSGISGLDITQELRKQPLTVDMPIIALTAYAMKSDEEDALRAGCSNYLSKPFTKKDLLEKVNIYLNSRDLIAGSSRP